ncbi:type II secretion system protein GspM [Candidatus Coxiella mudrowiae]|uniref:type II secretion system protein GspM n=1 Tax=Candidatus Coxiella mudrowiae TaxID=2054173 RepID=UPI000C281D10|nr:type II secretion system protein GspM [Candidatus Coxiella mudrowiae]
MVAIIKERERRLINVGGLLIMNLLVYLLILSPLSMAIVNLQTYIASQKFFIVWAKHAGQQIHKLR